MVLQHHRDEFIAGHEHERLAAEDVILVVKDFIVVVDIEITLPRTVDHIVLAVGPRIVVSCVPEIDIDRDPRLTGLERAHAEAVGLVGRFMCRPYTPACFDKPPGTHKPAEPLIRDDTMHRERFGNFEASVLGPDIETVEHPAVEEVRPLFP